MEDEQARYEASGAYEITERGAQDPDAASRRVELRTGPRSSASQSG
jgi:hypothetical protein